MVKVEVPEDCWLYPPALLGGVPVLVGEELVGVTLLEVVVVVPGLDVVVVVPGLDVVVVVPGLDVVVLIVLELDAVPGRHWE